MHQKCFNRNIYDDVGHMGNDYTQTIAFSSDDSSTELNRSKGGEGGLILMVKGVANILVHIDNTAIPSSKN